MDFLLHLGEDLTLKSSGRIVVRQGTHNMDSIKIDVGKRYEGCEGFVEFELPTLKKYASHVIPLGEDIDYPLPYSVTLSAGLGNMQLVVINGDSVERSQMVPFDITPSVCALHEAFEDGKSIEKSILDLNGELKCKIKRYDELCNQLDDVMHTVKSSLPVIGDNGNWWINGADTNKPSRGERVVVTRGNNGDLGILQSMGDSRIATMSQDVITRCLNARFDMVRNIDSLTTKHFFKDIDRMCAGLIFVGEVGSNSYLIMAVFKSDDTPLPILHKIGGRGIDLHFDESNNMTISGIRFSDDVRGCALIKYL